MFLEESDAIVENNAFKAIRHCHSTLNTIRSLDRSRILIVNILAERFCMIKDTKKVIIHMPNEELAESFKGHNLSDFHLRLEQRQTPRDGARHMPEERATDDQ